MTKNYYDRRKIESYRAISCYLNKIETEIENLLKCNFINSTNYNAIKTSINNIKNNIDYYV